LKLSIVIKIYDIIFPGYQVDGDAICFYNLSDDHGETRDLAKEQPEILKKLQSAWDHYAKDVGVVLTN